MVKKWNIIFGKYQSAPNPSAISQWWVQEIVLQAVCTKFNHIGNWKYDCKRREVTDCPEHALVTNIVVASIRCLVTNRTVVDRTGRSFMLANCFWWDQICLKTSRRFRFSTSLSGRSEFELDNEIFVVYSYTWSPSKHFAVIIAYFGSHSLSLQFYPGQKSRGGLKSIFLLWTIRVKKWTSSMNLSVLTTKDNC